MDPEPRAVLLLIVLWCLLGLVVWVNCRRTSRSCAPRTAMSRRLRPRSPDDCVLCQGHAAGFLRPQPCATPLRPWREGTRRRGAPRRVATEGYACPSPECAYYGITDSFMHALVGDGCHGKGARIQNFRCQACGTKVSARWGTPLYRLRTPTSRVGEVRECLGRRARGGGRGPRVRPH
jgi:hypothetical protein